MPPRLTLLRRLLQVVMDALERLARVCNRYIGTSTGVAPLLQACADYVTRLFKVRPAATMPAHSCARSHLIVCLRCLRCLHLVCVLPPALLAFTRSQLFGLVDPVPATGLSSGAAEGDRESTLRPILDALASFRQQGAGRPCATAPLCSHACDLPVRASARSGSTKDILSLCDSLRDDVLLPLGVKLEDTAEGDSKWKLDDPGASHAACAVRARCARHVLTATVPERLMRERAEVLRAREEAAAKKREAQEARARAKREKVRTYLRCLRCLCSSSWAYTCAARAGGEGENPAQ